MSNLIERKGLCAALRRNLAAHSPQADESMEINGFLRVKGYVIAEVCEERSSLKNDGSSKA